MNNNFNIVRKVFDSLLENNHNNHKPTWKNPCKVLCCSHHRMWVLSQPNCLKKKNISKWVWALEFKFYGKKIFLSREPWIHNTWSITFWLGDTLVITSSTNSSITTVSSPTFSTAHSVSTPRAFSFSSSTAPPTIFSFIL